MATRLKRTLGLFDAFAIGIGAIIGSGIFVVTGIAAGLAGPTLLISLIIGAIISGFTALSFAQLAQSMPAEGGDYKYAHELISPFAGFIACWFLDFIQHCGRCGGEPGICDLPFIIFTFSH